MSLLNEIQKLGMQATDPHMDGFSMWGAKQKLYQIMWEAQKQLDQCTTFYGELEWLEENEPNKSENNNVYQNSHLDGNNH